MEPTEPPPPPSPQKRFPLAWTVAALALLIAESLVVALVVSPVHWVRTALLVLVLVSIVLHRASSLAEEAEARAHGAAPPPLHSQATPGHTNVLVADY